MYHDSTLSPEKRAADLLSKMTIEEKLLQMCIYYDPGETYEILASTGKLEPRGGLFGSVKDEETINKLQEYCVNKTRLGIPFLFANDALRGVQNENATVLPQCAGIGCSFNRNLAYQMGKIIGEEAEAIGIRQVYSPDVDIPRDPRWGRLQETFGEDPYMSGEMGSAYVRGVQENAVAATVKHFIAYGIPEGGLNLAPAHIGEREIREIMLEPFKKCVDAGVMTVMPSYNEIDGEPVHASKRLLRSLLRDELGFDGMIINDYGALNMLEFFHRVAKNDIEAGKLALNAGVDMEAPFPWAYGENFRSEVKKGNVNIALIDEAVLRILTLKFKLGLFENPYTNRDKQSCMHNCERVEQTLRMEEETILLLENDGILPLSDQVGRVAVIGNNAKNSFLGDYINPNVNCVDFYSGMVNRLGAERVLYAAGCDPISCDETMISKAIDVANQADVIFLVLGDRASVGGGIAGEVDEWNKEVTCSEGYDMSDLSFPPSQQRLFETISSLKKPTVLVMYAGRPYAVKNEADQVNAFLFSFGGGEQNGNAFANLIFGDRSPSAKLAVSFPLSVGNIPCYYNYKPSARGSLYQKPGSISSPGRDYVLSSPEAWYPFGYGLSYTSFEYSDLNVKHQEDGSYLVSVTVKNSGKYDAEESVLLFVNALYAPITPLVKRLRNFLKVSLKSGQSKTVEFFLTNDDFTYIDHDFKTAKLSTIYQIKIADLSTEIEVE